MRHDPDDPTGPFSELIQEALAEAPERCDIRGGYTVVDAPVFDQAKRSLALGDQHYDLHKIVHGQMRKADRVALFICTAGPIGEWSRELASSGDTLKAYVVDVLGSEIVEFAVDRIQQDLAKRCEADRLRITNRFSPGYCNWSVAEQRLLFDWFPEGFCGVTLSDSCLMHPTKSVSGMIGIGDRVKFNPYLCNVCSDEMCIYRDRRLAGTSAAK
jgi:hypothetical protein